MFRTNANEGAHKHTRRHARSAENRSSCVLYYFFSLKQAHSAHRENATTCGRVEARKTNENEWNSEMEFEIRTDERVRGSPRVRRMNCVTNLSTEPSSGAAERHGWRQLSAEKTNEDNAQHKYNEITTLPFVRHRVGAAFVGLHSSVLHSSFVLLFAAAAAASCYHQSRFIFGTERGAPERNSQASTNIEKPNLLLLTCDPSAKRVRPPRVIAGATSTYTN